MALEAGGSEYHENTRAEYATPAQLGLLFDSTATWLSDHVPLYISVMDYVNGVPRFYQGLPFTTCGVPDHNIEIPGSLVTQLEPKAARQLDIDKTETVELTFVPAHYQESLEPSDRPDFVDPSCTYEVKTIRHDRSDATCFTSTNGYVDWSGSRAARREQLLNCDTMLVTEYRALMAISARMADFRAELVKQGLYPKDIIEHRRNKELADQADSIAQQFEIQAAQALEARLGKVATCGEIDHVTAKQLVFSYGKYGHAFENVSAQDINGLRIQIATKLLEARNSYHTFDNEYVQDIASAFHNPGAAILAKIADITLKSESSKMGSVFTFTITKETLRPDGKTYTEIEAFIFNKDRYVRQRRIGMGLRKDAPITMQITLPITSAQFNAFHKLLSSIRPPQ